MSSPTALQPGQQTRWRSLSISMNQGSVPVRVSPQWKQSERVTAVQGATAGASRSSRSPDNTPESRHDRSPGVSSR